MNYLVTQKQPSVLTLNGGSSSIKFAVYQLGDPPKRGLHGKVDRIAVGGTHLSFNDPARNQQESRDIGDVDHRAAAQFLFDWLDKQIGLASITAVGHRVVNGGASYHDPQRVTKEMLADLRGISDYAPEHFPARARAVFDVTGAGDTVISVLALALGAGAGLSEAARLANVAAGIVVEQVGTTAITLAQLGAGLAEHSDGKEISRRAN